MTTTKKNYVVPIVMMFVLFAMISFVTGLSNPMGVIIKNQPGIQNWMSQLGNFANFFAYLFMGLPAGLILRRKGYKFTALTAIGVGIVGVGVQLISANMSYTPGVTSFTPIFLVYLCGAFISGFSMCLLNTVVNPMLNTLGGGGRTGNQLLMWGGTINSIGATITPVLAGILIGNVVRPTIADVNPALWIAMGIFALAFVVLFLTNIPEPYAEAEAKSTNDTHSALSFRHFKLGAFGIFVYMALEVGVPNFVNLYMMAGTDAGGLGMDKATAGGIIGMYWFCMLLGRMLGGIFGSKFSSKSMITFVSTLGIILVGGALLSPDISVTMPGIDSNLSFIMVSVPLSVMLLIITGFCTSVMWGGIFNLAVEGLGKYTSMAAGIFMVMVCGGGFLPLLQGAIADSYGYMASFGLLIVLYFYILYYALVGSKNVNTDIVTE